MLNVPKLWNSLKKKGKDFLRMTGKNPDLFRAGLTTAVAGAIGLTISIFVWNPIFGLITVSCATIVAGVLMMLEAS